MSAVADGGEEIDTIEESPTSSSSSTSSCTPDPGFANCVEVDLSETDYWQDDLNNPDWRHVQQGAHGLDYQIFIYAHELNGGVIPTKSGQGEYEDFEDYYDTKSDLFGIDLADYNFSYSIVGSTVKQAKDGGPVEDSTGVFFYDALSNEDGKIIIDGIDRTEELINPDLFDYFVQEVDDGKHVSSLEESSMGVQSIPPYAGGLHTVVDDELLSDGYYPWIGVYIEYEADLRMLHRSSATIDGVDIHGEVATSISGVRRIRHQSYPIEPPEIFPLTWTWIPDSNNQFSEGVVQKHIPTADLLIARVDSYPGNGAALAITGDHTSVIAGVGWPSHASDLGGCGRGEAEFMNSQSLDDEGYVFTDPTLGSEECPNVDPP